MKKKNLRSKVTLWDFWNSIRDVNICTIGVLEAEERTRKLFEEIMAEGQIQGSIYTYIEGNSL